MLGALAGVYGPLEHRGIARIMSIGAGLLLAAASMDLALSAVADVGPLRCALALLTGAGAYSFANFLLSLKGAKDRKRCGGCVEQATEQRVPGSGLAIAIGTLLDAVPEGAVLGIQTSQTGAPTIAVLAAFALGNFPEALSSAAGMTVAKRRKIYIFSLWLSAALVVPLTAGLSAAAAGHLPERISGVLNAFAAGALLAVIIETMIPEGMQNTANFNGLLGALGFVLLLVLLAF